MFLTKSCEMQYNTRREDKGIRKGKEEKQHDNCLKAISRDQILREIKLRDSIYLGPLSSAVGRAIRTIRHICAGGSIALQAGRLSEGFKVLTPANPRIPAES